MLLSQFDFDLIFHLFFSTFLIDTLFDKTHAWATIGWIQKNDQKKIGEQRSEKNSWKRCGHTRFACTCTCIFHIPGHKQVQQARQVQAECNAFFISQWKMQFCSWCSFNCNLYEQRQRQRQQQNEYTQHDNNHFCNRISTPHLFTHALQIDNAQTEYKHKNGSSVSVKTKCVTVLHGL